MTRALCALFVLVLAVPLQAKNGAFRETRHGDRTVGPQRRTDHPRGSCVQCHEGHGGHNGANASLFAANDNELCLGCHNAKSALWARSTHGQIATVESATMRCGQCHDPHGVRDAKGVTPALVRARTPELCVGCHDGSRASDIRGELTRTFVHGALARGEHRAREEDDPQQYAAAPANRRHVDCGDCHNVHESTNGAPASAGVSRVEVDPSSSANALRFTWRGADERGAAMEYEVCFKCHSSWTKQPARQADLAALTIPGNPSFHPIQARGKNRNIAAASFVAGFSDTSRIACTDCHGSDESRARGLHGSRYEQLLRKPYVAAASLQSEERDNLCFHCHDYGVYADEAAPFPRRAASRFNEPGGAGHVFHVARQRIPCSGCHDPHGSTRFPALIVRGVPRGILNYTQTATGGTCQTTCHVSRAYSVNYAR